MHRALAAAAILLPLALPAAAQSGLDAQLADMARPWLAEENSAAGAAEIDATVECVMAVLGPLPQDVKTLMLAQDDFEDALDAAVKHDESLERPLEACF